jgi:hypothetical protein
MFPIHPSISHRGSLSLPFQVTLVSIVFKNPARPNDAPSLSFTLADTTIGNVKARLHQVLPLSCSLLLSLRSSDVTQVYPGEPDPADIKVIFAGQLLKDDALLSAVFESVTDRSAVPSAPCVPPADRALARCARAVRHSGGADVPHRRPVDAGAACALGCDSRCASRAAKSSRRRPRTAARSAAAAAAPRTARLRDPVGLARQSRAHGLSLLWRCVAQHDHDHARLPDLLGANRSAQLELSPCRSSARGAARCAASRRRWRCCCCCCCCARAGRRRSGVACRRGGDVSLHVGCVAVSRLQSAGARGRRRRARAARRRRSGGSAAAHRRGLRAKSARRSSSARSRGVTETFA